jgi:hypothetical protein
VGGGGLRNDFVIIEWPEKNPGTFYCVEISMVVKKKLYLLLKSKYCRGKK